MNGKVKGNDGKCHIPCIDMYAYAYVDRNVCVDRNSKTNKQTNAKTMLGIQKP